MAEQTTLVAPLMDVWIAALSRQVPDLPTIGRLDGLVQERRVVLLPGVRQRVLSRVLEDRQAQRLDWCLRGFGVVHLTLQDEEEAAARQRTWHRRGLPLTATQSLWWVLADRLQLKLWSRDHAWEAAIRHGAPVVAT